jgi:hypothetical protein
MMDDIYELIDKMITMNSKLRDALIKYRDAAKMSKQRIDNHLQEDLRILKLNVDKEIIIEEADKKNEISLMAENVQQIKEDLIDIRKKDRWIKWVFVLLVGILAFLGAAMTYINKLNVNEFTKELKQEIKK